MISLTLYHLLGLIVVCGGAGYALGDSLAKYPSEGEMITRLVEMRALRAAREHAREQIEADITKAQCTSSRTDDALTR